MIQKLYPAVTKFWLIFISGLMWSGVGIMLSRLAFSWLQHINIGQAFLLSIVGVFLGFVIYYFGFSKLANLNIFRIDQYENKKVCIFAFQQWTSYPLVLFMISLGIWMRKFSPIPKPYLSVLYLGIGTSLFFASLHYFVRLKTQSPR